MRLLYDLLSRETDEDNPLSTEQIISMLKNNHGITVGSRALIDDIKILNEYGYEVKSYRKKQYYFYVVDRDFDIAELKIMIDAVQAAGFIPAAQTELHYRTFESWLSNQKYTGEFYFGKRLCDNIFPQIIDKALFSDVQQRLIRNKELSGANTAIEPYLLTGKVFCGHCDTAMVSDGGTSGNGKKHFYYACKKKKKDKCDKKREEKNALELYVAENVREFLSDPENVGLAAADTVNYCEVRTGDDGMKSLESRINTTLRQVEEYTTAFVEARNAILRASIEKKMDELEIYLRGLQAQKAQIELERGRKVTKQRILDFVADLLKGDPSDKEYQKKLIDALVAQVFVTDGDDIITYLNLKGGKGTEKITLQQTNSAISNHSAVQSLSGVV